MVIKRKYCTYGQLMSDEKTKSMLLRVLQKTMPQEKAEWLMSQDSNVFVFNTDMGSGIPGAAYREIREELERLDETNPFDNGLSFSDVKQVVTFSNEAGSAVMQFMICRIFDLPEVIVQVVAFERDDENQLRFIEPWDVGQITF